VSRLAAVGIMVVRRLPAAGIADVAAVYLPRHWVASSSRRLIVVLVLRPRCSLEHDDEGR